MNNQDFYNPEDCAYNNSYIDQYAINAYVAKVFGWMFIGLLVTALTTGAILYGMENSMAVADLVFGSPTIFFGIFIGQLLLVGVISGMVHSMNPFVAKVLFLVYAATNAFTVGMIIVIYTMYILGPATVAMAFGITAVSFGVMSVYGLTTRADLTRFSSLFSMGLIGVVIASVANIFLGNSMLDFLVCVIGLFVFLGLTAVDTHKIKNHYAQVALRGSNPDGSLSMEQETLASNLAIHGALMLYLDFINMLLFILRLLGRRR